MKRITIAFFLIVFSLSSCNDNGKVLEVADKYTSQSVLPLFEDARISDTVPTILKEEGYEIISGKDRVTFFKKDYLEKLHYINVLEEGLFDLKKLQTQAIRFYGTMQELNIIKKGAIDSVEEAKHNKEFKQTFLENAIRKDYIDCVKKASSKEGFYIVSTNIKYGENRHFSYDILVTKNLEVLNTPIDTSNR